MKENKGFIEILALVLAGAALITGGLAYLGFKSSQQSIPPKLGASFTPVQAQKTYLSGAGITAVATTTNLTSLYQPDGVTAITMANFGSIGYATIDPGVPKKEENISFSGITQNANGTAVLTGVTRGLAFVYPYAASTTLAVQHSGGSTVVLSNSAAFYSQFAIANNTTTINANWTFNSSTIPKFSSDTTNAQISANGQNFVNYNTLASTSIAGAVPATTVNAGIVKIATSFDLANGNTTTTYSLVPDARSFSSSSVTSTAFSIPVAVSGTLATGFINQTASATYNFLGNLMSASTTLGGTTNLGTSTFSVAPTINTWGTNASSVATYGQMKAQNFPSAASAGVNTTVNSTSTFTLATTSQITGLSSGDKVTIDWSVTAPSNSNVTASTTIQCATTTLFSCGANCYVNNTTLSGHLDFFQRNSSSSQISSGYYEAPGATTSTYVHDALSSAPLGSNFSCQLNEGNTNSALQGTWTANLFNVSVIRQ